MTTVLRGGWVLTLDADDRELGTGDVLVRDGAIAAVDATVPVPDGAEVIDAGGMIVLPGFIDTHRHTWQTMVRHRGASWALADYLRLLLVGIGTRATPDDVYAGTLLGALGALDSGITTLVDWSHVQNSPAHADAAVRALREAGLRAVFAHGWAPHRLAGPARPHPDDIRRVRAELLADDNALVTLAMAALGPDFTDLDTTITDFGLARELGIPVTVHLAGGRPGDHPHSIGQLAGAGLLGADLTVVHGNSASEKDIALLAEYQVGVSVSPQSELVMPGLGAGTALRRFRAGGLAPSLSTDSEVVAATDMFTAMRLALAEYRAGAPDGEPPLAAREVLRMAAVDGARTAGLADRTGSLEVGKAADLVLLRATDLNLAPVSDPAAAIVLAAHPGNVDTVLVAGRVVKRGGVLLADAARAVALGTESAARLVT